MTDDAGGLRRLTPPVMTTVENSRLTSSLSYDFFPISRPAEGAFHERRETRGGMRWPCVRLRREAPHGGPSCDDPAHRPWVTSGG
ncbi:hypothetical protein DFP91_4209 [Pseudorhodoplanes sinuspersici]|nr:hypothetical protein DFP91_4209 [Pseudorhodoplanes sinuspersici]